MRQPWNFTPAVGDVLQRVFVLFCIVSSGCCCPPLARDGIPQEIVRTSDRLCRSLPRGLVRIERHAHDEEAHRALLDFEEELGSPVRVPVLRWSEKNARLTIENFTEADDEDYPPSLRSSSRATQWRGPDGMPAPPRDLSELIEVTRSRESWREGSLYYRVSITRGCRAEIDAEVHEGCTVLVLECTVSSAVAGDSFERVLVVESSGRPIGHFMQDGGWTF